VGDGASGEDGALDGGTLDGGVFVWGQPVGVYGAGTGAEGRLVRT